MSTVERLQVGFVAGGDDARRVAALEALPIDSLWVGGHIASTGVAPETMVSLARLSAMTERVTVGSSIVELPLYPPAMIAKMAADLDRATGGRLVLGIGVGGEYPAEFRACEVPIGERGGRANEAIGLLRQFWTANEVTHHGRYYDIESVRIHPAPVQPGGPPIVVAGRKEPAMRRAALLGDGWMPYLYSPRRYRSSVEVIRRTAAGAGRALDGFGWYAFVFVNVDADPEVARAGLAGALGAQYRQDFSSMVDGVGAAGTVAEVTAKVQAYVDAGARHLIFLPFPGPGRDPHTVVRMLVDEVMPAVAVSAGS